MPIKSTLCETKLLTTNNLKSHDMQLHSYSHQLQAALDDNQVPAFDQLESDKVDCTTVNFMKREDSAYCSSTSSTVSSQEVNDVNKCPLVNSIQCNSQISDEEASNKFANQIIEDADSLTKPPLTEHIHLKKSLTEIDSNFQIFDELPDKSSLPNNGFKSRSKRNSIKDSIGELNQLILMSNSTTQLMSTSSITNSMHEDLMSKSNCSTMKPRRTSSTSMSAVSLPASNVAPSPMFKPPSNLPPVENSEIIELDIDTYRLLLQDLQNTKFILHKLLNCLREPATNSFNSSGGINLLDNVFNEAPAFTSNDLNPCCAHQVNTTCASFSF